MMFGLTIDQLPVLAAALPFLGVIPIVLLGRWPNLREVASFITAGLVLACVLPLWPEVVSGALPSIVLAEPIAGLPIAFEVEPLGLLFAVVASVLWPVTTLYAIGYMRGHHEQNQTRFFAFFAMSIGATLIIAFAANLFTLFLGYELLTLLTFPLVTHHGTAEARAGGMRYLAILLGTSLAFLLLAIIWTWHLSGTLTFTAGGLLAADTDPAIITVLYILFVFGIGKAALMPFHSWLPAAMVAPTPVSALLHAVAVVKAGVFSVLKITVYVFGIDLLGDTGASEVMMWVAAFTLLMASLVAMTKDNLKARLAYSTISQLAYVVLGATLATSMGIMGGTLQIAMHAVGKITLFFCAGAILVAAHKTRVSQLDGLGRRMPFTFAAFTIGALSIIGLPPLGGAWSKWYLMVGAADAGQILMIGVLMVSSLLSIAYLLPVPARAFFRPSSPDDAHADDGHGDDHGNGLREAPLACVLPLCVTALACIGMFFFGDAIYVLMAPVVDAAPLNVSPTQ